MYIRVNPGPLEAVSNSQLAATHNLSMPGHSVGIRFIDVFESDLVLAPRMRQDDIFGDVLEEPPESECRSVQ
jgi:hypothetical protein